MPPPVCEMTPLSTVLEPKLPKQRILPLLPVQAILRKWPLPDLEHTCLIACRTTVVIAVLGLLLRLDRLLGRKGSWDVRHPVTTLVVVRVLGCLTPTPMLRCLGSRTVGLTTLLWPSVLTMTMPLRFLMLLTLDSSRGMTAPLILSDILEFWAWNSELTLLKNMTIGTFLSVPLWVCRKISWTRCLALFIHPPSSLGFPTPRKKDCLVLKFLWVEIPPVREPVMVPVTSAPL